MVLKLYIFIFAFVDAYVVFKRLRIYLVVSGRFCILKVVLKLVGGMYLLFKFIIVNLVVF